jgi:hypothetical protein
MFEGHGDVTDNQWPIEKHDAEAELSGQDSEDGKWEEKVDNPALMMDDPEPELYEESDSDEDEDDIGNNYVIWEPPPPQVTGSDVEFLDEPEEDLGLSREARLAAEDAFRKCPVIEKYPDSHAGAPVTHDRVPSRNESYAKSVNNDIHNPLAPFSSQTDWEIAQWAKLCGPGSTAMSDLLKINGVSQTVLLHYDIFIHFIFKVVEKLGLSYQNTQELNAIIDKKTSKSPKVSSFRGSDCW